MPQQEEQQSLVAAVHSAAPYADSADAGDRAVETAELLELAGVTDAVAQQLSRKSNLSSQMRKLMGIQSSNSNNSSSPRGSMHRKLLIYSGPQVTRGFVLSYRLSLQLDASSGNSNATLLSNPNTNFELYTSVTDPTVIAFKGAVETAVARLMPLNGASVLPPVVDMIQPGSSVVMTLTMWLNMDAALKAAAAGTGLPPNELLATVEAAVTGVQALKMEMGATSVTSSYAVASITVQSGGNNKDSIAGAEAFMARSRPTQRGGGLSNFPLVVLVALIVIPVAVGVAVGLRLRSVMRTRRRAEAAAAAANPMTAPAINIGPVQMGPAATAAPVMGTPYNGSYSYSAAGQSDKRAASPPGVVSPFAAYAAAPAVGTAAGAGHGVQYGAHMVANGSAAYSAVQAPYGVAPGKSWC
ncbi:hypothetical protein OEZ85_013388 [Tetradesmus obliquus]|uniref:Uncharacterized protein n=1 Tax=Tetradesmus obliquus TaxID=3088 RepID=A0ABY8U5L2_TETOB|nr:hypothetical protein OEZ85_013388 [Tetradesmus obliquus]